MLSYRKKETQAARRAYELQAEASDQSLVGSFAGGAVAIMTDPLVASSAIASVLLTGGAGVVPLATSLGGRVATTMAVEATLAATIVEPYLIAQEQDKFRAAHGRPMNASEKSQRYLTGVAGAALLSGGLEALSTGVRRVLQNKRATRDRLAASWAKGNEARSLEEYAKTSPDYAPALEDAVFGSNPLRIAPPDPTRLLTAEERASLLAARINETTGATPKPDGQPDLTDEGIEAQTQIAEMLEAQKEISTMENMPVTQTDKNMAMGLREVNTLATRLENGQAFTPSPEMANEMANGLPEGLVLGESVILKGAEMQSIQFNPQVFQFKEYVAGTKGVVQIGEGIDESSSFYEPAKGVGVVYQDFGGTNWVVDGHQRLNFFNTRAQAGDKNVNFQTYLLKEEDGWTPELAMHLASRKNIIEGSGTAFDQAKYLKTLDPEVLEHQLSKMNLTQHKARTAIGLMTLEGEAWKRAIQGYVKPELAALVGRMVRNPKRQHAVMIEVKRHTPNDPQAAQNLIEQIDFEEVQTESLFGKENVLESTYADRAAILTKTQRSLMKDKRLGFVLSRHAPDIEKMAQNRLDRAANLEIGEQAAKANELLRILGNRVGTTQAKLLSAGAKEIHGITNKRHRATRIEEIADTIKRTLTESGSAEQTAGKPTLEQSTHKSGSETGRPPPKKWRCEGRRRRARSVDSTRRQGRLVRRRQHLPSGCR